MRVFSTSVAAWRSFPRPSSVFGAAARYVADRRRRLGACISGRGAHTTGCWARCCAATPPSSRACCARPCHTHTCRATHPTSACTHPNATWDHVLRNKRDAGQAQTALRRSACQASLLDVPAYGRAGPQTDESITAVLAQCCRDTGRDTLMCDGCV